MNSIEDILLGLSPQSQDKTENSPPPYKTPTPTLRHVSYDLPSCPQEDRETKEEQEQINIEPDICLKTQIAIEQDIKNKLAEEKADSERRELEARELAKTQVEQQKAALVLFQQQEKQMAIKATAVALAAHISNMKEEAAKYGI